MPQKNQQKMKMLFLVEMLRECSDEQHPLTTQEIVERIRAHGITCDRRTVSIDMAQLNEYGIEVMSVMLGHKKAYYMDDSHFAQPELRILIDAVQAAGFITEKKSAALIDKLAALGGKYRADALKENRICFHTQKHRNEAILYNVDTLEEALQRHCVASFLYFDLNENHEKIYRKDKQRYVVEPLALVFHEDFYYLVTYSAKYKNLCHYRVDRMDHVSVEETPISESAEAQRPALTGYTEELFKMFGGDTETVTLELSDTLIGAFFDKFGEDIKLQRVASDRCCVTLDIRISPPFWGWLFQFGAQIQIIAPESVRAEYKACIKAIDAMYQ